MNQFTTYQVWNCSTNKPVSGTVKFNLEDCISLAKGLHFTFPENHYSVQDVTCDNFTIELYNTKGN